VRESLGAAVQLFNDGRFAEFQDALEGLTSATRAPSERQFYTLLDHLAEALLQLSDGDLEDAEALISSGLRKLDEFVPRFPRAERRDASGRLPARVERAAGGEGREESGPRPFAHAAAQGAAE
jgi:hypothetical protein